jgi:hypothetical protein
MSPVISIAIASKVITSIVVESLLKENNCQHFLACTAMKKGMNALPHIYIYGLFKNLPGIKDINALHYVHICGLLKQINDNCCLSL